MAATSGILGFARGLGKGLPRHPQKGRSSKNTSAPPIRIFEGPPQCDSSDLNAGPKACSRWNGKIAATSGMFALLTAASLEVFRGTPKRALLETYLKPTQFEYSKGVRGVLARYFSRYSSSLL
jgi:hypothetical protein